MKKIKKLRKGFTLVELVVVIAVIAILAGVSVGAYFGITDSANSSNATQGAKQVKDLWTMYAVSDYDSKKTLKENALDFCLDYVIENGPEYYVNYALVDIEAKQDPNEGVQPLYNNIKRAGSLDEATGSSILFKVETTYPTWFLVNDTRIIEEGQPSKSDTDFNNSFEGSRLDETYEAKAVAGTLNFEIEEVGTDENGKKVRGFKYYEITIDNSPHGDENTKVDTVYVRPEHSIVYPDEILEHRNEEYIQSECNYEINGDKYFGYDLKLIDLSDNSDFVSSTSLKLDDSFIRKIDNTEYKYGYIVNEKKLKYVDLSNKTAESNKEYSLCIVTAEFDTSGTPYYTSEWATEDYGTKRSRTHYYGLKNYNFSFIQDENYLSTFDIPTKSDIATYIFARNLVISKQVIIPENVVLIVDYNFNKETMKETVSSSSYVTKNEVQRGITIPFVGSSWSDSSWTEAKKSNIGETFYKINNSRIDTKRDYTTMWSGEEDVKSTLRITNRGSLVVQNGGYVLVEGHISLPASNGIMHIGKRGVIINDGNIQLNNGSKLRAFSTISGTGTITSESGSEVIELMKFRDYEGGTNTATMIISNLFPFLNYSIDNIQCKLILKTGSEYANLAGMYMGDINFVTPPIFMVSNTQDSLFKLEKDSEVVKYCSNDLNNPVSTIEIKKGTVKDGTLKVNLKINISILNIERELDSRKVIFPISNLNIIVKENATLKLQNSDSVGTARYEVYPNSCVMVEQNANLYVQNGVKLAFINKYDFATIVNNSDLTPAIPDQVTFFNELSNYNQPQFINNGNVHIDNSGFFYNYAIDKNTSENIYEFIQNNGIINFLGNIINENYSFKYHEGKSITIKPVNINDFPVTSSM